MTAGETGGSGPGAGADAGPDGAAGRLTRVAVFPVKSLDPEYVDRATVGERGALDPDRTYALLDADGEYVNGKREPAVHRLRSRFDLDDGTLALRRADEEGAGEWHRFDPEADREALEAWLTEYFGYPVECRHDDAGGYPDDRDAHGPTVISTATLKAVASWFPGVTVESVRRRFRANLEVAGVPAFWEDRLYGPPGEQVPFRVGDATLRGDSPCRRCVVPTRDPWTGEPTEGFRERFVERREATLPAWAERSQFEGFYRLMVNTRVPEAEWGTDVTVGDRVAIGTR